MIFCFSIRKACLILSRIHLAHTDPPQALLTLTCFFVSDHLIRTSWSHNTDFAKSAWAHATYRFWCFPNLLGIKPSLAVPATLLVKGSVKSLPPSDYIIIAEDLNLSISLGRQADSKSPPMPDNSPKTLNAPLALMYISFHRACAPQGERET
ncbi:uncharacterized protein [Desmodus rotundus]|uniref:uncharacterized protein n=1 Tax=Desmodus rotundus TaxID=9430 RepID=UPI00238119A7|nr:uncharacterized protein LOC123480883 isoform X2 [Desmodus rotundus]